MKSNRGWRMRVLGLMVLVLLLPGQVWAAPDPPPPGDYPGAQYIDRTGCVFMREGDEWAPRLDKQGARICGFPPSQAAQGVDPDIPSASPEDVLSEVMAQGLRAGDLLKDQRVTPLAEAAPDPAQAVLDATLQDQIELDARLRSAMAGQAPDGLCARLGYRPEAGATPIIGGDVTQGLCPGMTAPDPQPQITAVSAAAPLPVTAAEPAVTARGDIPTPKPARVAESASKPPSVIARRPAPPKIEVRAKVEMIPAHARYVEIGAYADAGNAMTALRRLSALGYRTAQRDQKVGDKPGKAVLAGPFADRQALVTALNRLRATGYPRAMAR